MDPKYQVEDTFEKPMNPTAQQKIADGGVVVAWIGWIVSHIAEINAFLQTGVLLLSIAATLIALRANLKRK